MEYIPGHVLTDCRVSHVLILTVLGHIVTDHFWHMTGSRHDGPIGPPGFCAALGSTLGVWAAHGEGKAYFPDEAVLDLIINSELA